MIYYYYVFLFISLFIISDFQKYNKKNVITFFPIFFLLFLFAGLRDPYSGGDYYNYITMFNLSPMLFEAFDINSYLAVRTEPGYYLLNSLLKLFTSEYEYIFMVMAFLTIALNLHYYKKYSPYFVLSVLIYFSHIYLHREFIQIRAGLACAILFIAIPYLYKRSFLKYSIVVFFAASIHIGSVVFFIIYFIYKKDRKTKHYIYLIFSSILFALLVNIKELLLLINSIELLPNAIYMYISWENYNYSLGLLNPLTVKQLLVSLFLLKFRFQIASSVKYFDSMLFMYIISTVWLIIFNDFAILAARVATFLSIADVILFPVLILLFKQKKTIYFDDIILNKCIPILHGSEPENIYNKPSVFLK